MDILGLKPWLLRQCETIGLKAPTPVQQATVSKILKGANGVGIAKTGSGKTAAFALPILDALSEDPYGILGKPLNVKVSIIVGGRDMVMQGSELSTSPHILIATPGHEADRLLEGGFDEQLSQIFTAIPSERQTLLFTATHTEALKDLIEVNSDKQPFFYREGEDDASSLTVNTLEQYYVLTPADFRDAYLVGVIMKNARRTELLSMTLTKLGFSNVSLHSMKPQRERLQSLSRFRSHLAKILIATDVASRGLDIQQVEYVINHNIPTDAKDYVHRVGRTARAGRKGSAISLLTPHDVLLIQSIEVMISSKLSEFKVSDKNITEIVVQVNVTRREQDIKLTEADFDEKRRLNKERNSLSKGLIQMNVEGLEEGPSTSRKRLALEDPKQLCFRLKEEGIQLALENKLWSAVRVGLRQEMKAQSFIQLHEWPLAIESARFSLQSGGSNYYPAWQTLGRAHLGTGELSEALAAFSKALHLCPDDVELFSEDFLWALSLKSRHDLHQNPKMPNKLNTHKGFYTNVLPNFTVMNVDKPPCYLRKFTPDGKRFIAFSSCQTFLEIYCYNGPASIADLIYNTPDKKIKQVAFNQWRVKLSSNGEQLNRECSLFLDGGKFIIVGSACYLPQEHLTLRQYHKNNESLAPNPRYPLENYTLYCVKTDSGTLIDEVSLNADKVRSASNYSPVPNAKGLLYSNRQKSGVF
ncbi:DDX49 [Lepeophtheirus salmonis]|uniref:RNA helicase n=1 Tax=Lepeophtheirus salmonis TaxID=72036 RepID=A0A7R8HB63_LEPSM|nr:DDX49 [Lepeophtheirus salmonis]CAF2980200.1 DDX49 [Lepeophtheirus salmonis]